MPGVASIPGVLIHGRYDVSSPLDTAWHLHQAWPASHLTILDDAGHGGNGFAGAMVSALAQMRESGARAMRPLCRACGPVGDLLDSARHPL